LPEVNADTKLMMSVATLTVSWNWMNFWMLLKTLHDSKEKLYVTQTKILHD